MAGWEKVRLRADLHAATGLHVLVDKDVTAAATGERWAKEGARHHYVFCYLGPGLGAGVVMDDVVLRGASNNIGEIGNIIVHPGAEDLGVGLPGSLAAACLPRALVARAGRRGLITSAVSLDDFVAVDEVFTTLCERAYAGEAACLQLIDEAATALAAGLAVLVNALDVDRAALADRSGPGSAVGSWPSCRVDPTAAGGRPAAAGNQGSAVGEHVAAQGAAALVLDHFLSPRPSVLLMD